MAASPEPATALTDALLAALAVVLGWRLERSGRREASTARRLWGACFGAVAVAAGLGMLRHGLRPALAPGTEHGLWQAEVVSIAAASALLLAGAALGADGGRSRRLLIGVAGAKLVLLVLWLLLHRDYAAVALDASASGALAFVVLARAARAGTYRGVGALLAGIFFGVGGAAVRHAGWGPHPAFDENALFHLVLMLALGLLFRAGQALGEGSSRLAAGQS